MVVAKSPVIRLASIDGRPGHTRILFDDQPCSLLGITPNPDFDLSFERLWPSDDMAEEEMDSPVFGS